MNKTKLGLGNALKTILMLTVLSATAVADDAAIKRQLVGRWDGRIIVLKSDGTMNPLSGNGMCGMVNTLK